METMNNNHPWSDPAPAASSPDSVAPPPVRRSFVFSTGGKELVYALLALISGLMMCNCVIFGGFELGFGIAMCVYIISAAGYLLAAGGRLSVYSTLLLLLSMGISAGFGRSDDGFVKFVMVCFLTVSVNLGLCLLSGQNRHRLGGAGSMLDAGRTVFTMGYGQLPKALGGLFGALRLRGSLARTVGSIAIGLLIMVPVLGIVMTLLIKADAAFENMMKMVPKANMSEAFVTVFFGIAVFFVMYTRVVALARREKDEPVAQGSGRGLSKITMNTALIGLCAVYLLYLVSQLAYFVSGFAGIVPEGYSRAEYARRGFFEMAWLCAINMGLNVFSVTLVRKSGGRAPLSTRLLCLFVGLVTLFLVAAASAKMLTYIDGYGLTRLRVMTQLIILFFGLAAVTVSVSLFLKKPRYMPVLLIGALLLGGSAFWVDVDTLVAAYNVSAYQHGVLETVDVEYLGTLSSGAIPQIAKLLDDQDPQVAEAAQRVLNQKDVQWQDFRDWNYADWRAKPYVSPKEDSDHSQTEY